MFNNMLSKKNYYKNVSLLKYSSFLINNFFENMFIKKLDFQKMATDDSYMVGIIKK